MTPGLRYEHLRFKITDRRGAETERSRGHLDVFAPGIGVTYAQTDNARIIGGVQNLLDRDYIASRLPHGPRPGHPRFASVSMEVTF